MIWFIEAKIHKQLYMGEETIFPHRTIVIADDYDQALQKYMNYWDAKTDEYAVYYSVNDYNLEEAIT